MKRQRLCPVSEKENTTLYHVAYHTNPIGQKLSEQCPTNETQYTLICDRRALHWSMYFAPKGRVYHLQNGIKYGLSNLEMGRSSRV
jgi:hypothetical protein